MANYQELLRRAISALPENNGSARREVYERARKALVNQLRAITPPLPAREITQHRLELEDSIRQVEQEATENLLGGLKSLDTVAPEPQPKEPTVDVPAAPKPQTTSAPAPAAPKPAAPQAAAKAESSIDAIIAKANAESAHDEPVEDDEPQVVADPEAVKEAEEAEAELQRKLANAAQPVEHAAEKLTAKSEVRHVDLEEDDDEDDAQSHVDRAIEMLDREARGEQGDDDDVVAPTVDRPTGADKTGAQTVNLKSAASPVEETGGNALAVFLVLAVVLLAAVGGGGYWAWREGFIPLDAVFGGTSGETDQTVVAAADTTPPAQPETPVIENPVSGDADIAADVSEGPGNTATDDQASQPADQAATISEATDKVEERLDTITPDSQTDAAPNVDDSDKVEERLTAVTEEREPDPAIDTDAGQTPVVASSAQSLLLEASVNGTTGLEPLTGSMSWSRGVDELGEPTLVATANIPARNLGIKVLIRRNADPTLPASHLMEIEFSTPETFAGGSVASFGGILFKNEQLVPGKALVGAPARIFENMFLFALSAAEQDQRTNIPLMRDNKWMDLALVYGTGRQAIVTLEKDEAAQALFEEVMAAWEAAASANSDDASGASDAVTG